jgi:hypothetical protein
VSSAAVVDGTPDFSLQTSNGLYIWRTSTGDWQVRLLSGTTKTQNFKGAFQANNAMSIKRRISLEGDDIAKLSGSNLLHVTLSVNQGGADGVKFFVAKSADLCLWEDGASGTKMYLGKNAVLATAPVDLSGTDACNGASPFGGGSTTPTPEPDPTPPPPTTGGRKFNVGHYTALMSYDDSHATMLKSIKPGTVGFLKRYTWRELEPSLGNYNFSEIVSDLELVASQGMQLVAMIEDKSFKNTIPVPNYLAGSKYLRPNRAGGYTIARWDPYVIKRFKALLKALGQRVDGHPNFEGVATMETAPSLDKEERLATGYTPAKYRDALITVLRDATRSLPTSRVFWFMNFLPGNNGYLDDVANAVKSYGVVLGGPDVAPDSAALVKHAYPLHDKYKGKMPMFGQVEPMVYRHLHEDTSAATKYWTMWELFRYARDKLHVNYMFWVRLTKANPPDSYDWFDALPVIANNPVFNQ